MFDKYRPSKCLVCFVLALGTALLYWPVLHFDYVNYDDPLYILNNQHIKTLSWQSLGWAFQNDYAHLWHPLTWISHILDYYFYSWNHPGGHHATSMVLHIFNSTLLFVVLNRMTKALWPSAMVAALFAWHPLHVESVAWISERKDVLSAFFWMLTIWAYVRYTEQVKKPGSSAKVFYALALLFFALGLMSKPILVMLPFVLLLLDWWPLHRFQLQGSATPETKDSTPSPSCRGLILEKIPFLVLSILASVMTLRAASSLISPLATVPLRPRLINAGLTYLRYVEKMIWPQGLVAVYPMESRWSNEVILAGLFLVGVSIAAIRLWKARPFWLVGWLWYLVILIPVIGLVDVGTPPLADHNTYLPSIGIFIILCWEARDLAGGWRNGPLILGIAAVAVLGACLGLSWKQLHYWKNPVTLYSHNLEVTPDNYAARADYAAYLRDSSQLEAARQQCEIAIRLSPNYAWSYDVLGGVYFLEGKLDKAAEALRIGLRLNPARMDVHIALAKIALAQDSPAEAVAQCAPVLAAEPSNPQAHCELGRALVMQGKMEEARAQYAEALRLAPGYADAHFEMGVILAARHNIPEGIAQYKTVLEIQTNRTDAMNNIAWIRATATRPENRNGAEAVQMATCACVLTANKSPFLMGTLAAAYAEAGRFDEAIAAAENAVDLANKAGNKPLADRNRELLALYRSHQPYHEK